PLVDAFMQSDVWWALKSQRDMAIDERISNVMNLGTHNSFNASAEGFVRWVLFIGVDYIGIQPNQLFAIWDQLRMGVRLIELDVYDKDVDDDGNKELVVMHNETYGRTAKAFYSILSEIRSWLIAQGNENEIIFLDIEDHASGDTRLLGEILDHFGNVIFTPVDREGDPFYGRWPTRNELLDLGKRVIIFTHGDFSDGPIRLFELYSEEDQKLYKWLGSDHFFLMGPTAYPELNPYTNMTDKTINDYWDGNNLPPDYQQDLEKFFVVRSDGLTGPGGALPRAMVGWDVAYCATNNVNFIKMDFVLGQEYDIEDWSGTSRNDFDTPGGWDNDFEMYSFLDNFRGNRLSRAIWSWQIDTYRHDPNIYLLSYQELHSPTARVANRTDGRHYVVQEGFPFDPDISPLQLILTQDWLGVATDPTNTYFRTTRGHWNTQQKENVHPFACAKIGSNRTEWRITERAGPWDEGAKVCDEEFNNKDEGTWVFAGPVNGYQNLLLLAARWEYAKQDPNRIAVAEEPVWINVSDEDNDADWTVREGAPPIIEDGQLWPEGGDGGLCFIATAAYGSRMAKEVEVFEKVRDEYLLNHGLGRAFVSGYYKYSPPLARWIVKHPAMRRMVRIGLYPVLEVSKCFMGEIPSNER
ncbi:MAG: phosphatidylinositol-specific phospholipase C domain-containing protein, partial [Desulfatiglandales bacterium]